MRDGIAKKIIEDNNYMIIATADRGSATPWITPVYYAYDDKFTFYWYSGKNTKHSQIITQNSTVAIVIFDSQFADTDESYGVYMTGAAQEVEEELLSHALTIYFGRAFSDNSERGKLIEGKEDFLADSPLRMYKFTPKKIFLSTDAERWKGKWIDSREEIRLV